MDRLQSRDDIHSQEVKIHIGKWNWRRTWSTLQVFQDLDNIRCSQVTEVDFAYSSKLQITTTLLLLSLSLAVHPKRILVPVSYRARLYPISNWSFKLATTTEAENISVFWFHTAQDIFKLATINCFDLMKLASVETIVHLLVLLTGSTKIFSVYQAQIMKSSHVLFSKSLVISRACDSSLELRFIITAVRTTNSTEWIFSVSFCGIRSGDADRPSLISMNAGFKEWRDTNCQWNICIAETMEIGFEIGWTRMQEACQIFSCIEVSPLRISFWHRMSYIKVNKA